MGADVPDADSFRAGWKESSAVIRNGCSGVEFVAPSPPSELVMSAATMRPPWSHGSVKSSSVMRATLPSATPEARTWPLSGRVELWMKSVPGCATPSSPPGRPPPATRTGSQGLATRTVSVLGSRHLPPRRVAEQAAATADPGDAVAVDVDVVRIVGQPIVAPEVDRFRVRLRVRGILEVRYPDRAAVAPSAGRERPQVREVVPPRRPARPHVVAAI